MEAHRKLEVSLTLSRPGYPRVKGHQCTLSPLFLGIILVRDELAKYTEEKEVRFTNDICRVVTLESRARKTHRNHEALAYAEEPPPRHYSPAQHSSSPRDAAACQHFSVPQCQLHTHGHGAGAASFTEGRQPDAERCSTQTEEVLLVATWLIKS